MAELKTLSDEAITESEEKILKLLGGHVASLQNKQPLNNFGIPVSYIDPQAIAETGLSNDLSESEIENSKVTIEYLDGIPTIDGLPFWERLDGEIFYFYKIFKIYRDMRETDGTRSIAKTAQQSGQKESAVHSLSKVYHWQDRTKAYDTYRAGEIEKIKQNNMIKMENKHYKLAEEMFDDIKDILKNLIKELKSSVTTKKDYQLELRKWLEMAVKLERLSLGLPANKPLDSNAVTSVIANYTLNQSQFQDNRQVNIDRPSEKRLDKMQEVVDVLRDSGVLEEVLKGKNGNGGKEVEKIIDVTEEADA